MRGDIAQVESSPVTIVGPERPLRIALFGAGRAARFHLDALDLIGGVEVAGVCSRSGITAGALVTDRPGALATSDAGDLIDPDRIDAAFVAVSYDQSAPLAARLLDAGIAVLLEKPAAPTAAAADALADVAAQTGTLAVVGMNRRYYSLVAAALGAVRQRGPIRGVVVEGHEPVDQLRRSGISGDLLRRYFILDSIHYVDLLRLAGGDVAEVTSVVGSVRVPEGDHISASVRFTNGAVGSYVAHWNSAAPQVLRLYGEEATAHVRLTKPETGIVELAGDRRIALETDWADQVAKPGVYLQDTAFLQAVADGRPPALPASSLRDHVATLRLAEEVLARGR